MNHDIVPSRISGNRMQRHASKAVAQSEQAAELEIALHRNRVAADMTKAEHVMVAGADLSEFARNIELMMERRLEQTAYQSEFALRREIDRLARMSAFNDHVIQAFARKSLWNL